MQKYLKAKSDLGAEELKLLKVLFFGPPGAGKSTLLSVLLHQDIQSLRESTGVLDKKLVQYKLSVKRNTLKSESHWKVVDINEEILRLRRTIEKVIEERNFKHESDDSPTDLKPDLKIDERLESVSNTDNKDEASSIQQQLSSSNTLIACYDSGGQPEFFDVMPAFVTATTGNVMIFDMSKSLDLKLKPEYFKNDRQLSSSDVLTHYTGTQLLKTALANIQSYATRYSLCSTTKNTLKVVNC